MDGTKGASLRKSLAQGGVKLLIATTVAVCLTCLLLILEARRLSRSSSLEEMRLFQRTIGGLGMGAAATPAWNILHFDPRLQSIDDSNLWPVAGSYPYSPSAASAVIALKELPREDLTIIRIEP
jgi:hypothetical protein